MEMKGLNVSRFLFRLYAIVLVCLSIILISTFIINKDYITTELSTEKYSASEIKALNQEQIVLKQKRHQLLNKIQVVEDAIKALREEKLTAGLDRRTDIWLEINNKEEYLGYANKEVATLNWQILPASFKIEGKAVEKQVFNYKGIALSILILLGIWVVPYTIHLTIEWVVKWLIRGLRG